MTLFSLLLTLAACGGEPASPPQKPAGAPAETAPTASTPAPSTAPAEAPAATPVASGPYTPGPLAKAAYDKAVSEGGDKTTVNPMIEDAAAAEKGKVKYDQLCASCHGAQGMGDGVARGALPQKPASFADASRWSFTPVGVKHWIVRNGIAGTAMANMGLSDEEAWQVLAHIERNFLKK